MSREAFGSPASRFPERADGVQMHLQAYRLPAHTRPLRYDVRLEAHLGAPVFRGNVAIRLELCEARAAIDLHARDLELFDARLVTRGQLHTGVIQLDPERELAIIHFAEL